MEIFEDWELLNAEISLIKPGGQLYSWRWTVLGWQYSDPTRTAG